MHTTEIERKFKVEGDAWRGGGVSVSCVQGYVCFGPPVSVRVRLIGDRAFVTLKRSPAAGDSPGEAIERLEFEFEVPANEARIMLDTCCEARVEKTRHYVLFGGRKWEVDEFEGKNAGLVIAEIELEDANAKFERPRWLGEEVSGDSRYLNVNLARNPYRDW